MANYATNLFFASTKNQNDLDRIDDFLNENFCDCYVSRDTCDNGLEAEFFSRWEYPESLIDELIDSLEQRDEIYIRVLTYELCTEYVSFRIFDKGEWDIRY